LLIVPFHAEILDLNIYVGISSTVHYISALQYGHVSKSDLDYSRAPRDSGSAWKREGWSSGSWGFISCSFSVSHSLSADQTFPEVW